MGAPLPGGDLQARCAIILRRHAKTGGLFPPLLCNRTLRPLEMDMRGPAPHEELDEASARPGTRG
jgi:hypothetical protein